jgi:SOS-response transcriptional repressor LexA
MSNNCEILDLDVKCDTLVPYYDMGISCGLPTEMGDIPPEMVMVPGMLTMDLNVGFARAQGDSMIGVGIHDGDLLMLERTCHFNNQDIVAAWVDGAELLKSYYMDEHGRHWLVPSNDRYDAMLLTEEMDVKFAGRMVWNMRKDVHETTRNIR